MCQAGGVGGGGGGGLGGKGQWQQWPMLTMFYQDGKIKNRVLSACLGNARFDPREVIPNRFDPRR